MRFLILFALALGSCGTAAPRHYVLSLPSYDVGVLLARDEDDDLPVSVCTPDQVSQSKCIVVLEEEWDRLQRELIDLRVRLEACEKTCGN